MPTHSSFPGNSALSLSLLNCRKKTMFTIEKRRAREKLREREREREREGEREKERWGGEGGEKWK